MPMIYILFLSQIVHPHSAHSNVLLHILFKPIHSIWNDVPQIE